MRWSAWVGLAMIAVVMVPFAVVVVYQAFRLGGITLLAVLLLLGGGAFLIASDR